MDYRNEFKDYDDVLPDLSPLADFSWHNDMCPCFAWEDENDPDLSLCRVELWCDYKALDLRECPVNGNKRFVLIVRERTGDVITQPVTAETLEQLREACNMWYLAEVGYRPDSEVADLALGQLLLDVGQLAFLHKHGVSACEAGGSRPVPADTRSDVAETNGTRSVVEAPRVDHSPIPATAAELAEMVRGARAAIKAAFEEKLAAQSVVNQAYDSAIAPHETQLAALRTKFSETAIALTKEDAPLNRHNEARQPDDITVHALGVDLRWEADHPNDVVERRVSWDALLRHGSE